MLELSNLNLAVARFVVQVSKLYGMPLISDLRVKEMRDLMKDVSANVVDITLTISRAREEVRNQDDMRELETTRIVFERHLNKLMDYTDKFKAMMVENARPHLEVN